MLRGMKTNRTDREAFVPARRAAASLGVPIAWLKREAEAGRVPAVRAGRRLLIHLDDARATLAERAKAGEGVR